MTLDPQTPPPEDPNAVMVLAITHKQAALTAICMTAGMISGLVPIENIAAAAEIVGIINEAIGNPTDPGFTDAIARLKEKYGG